MAGPRGIKGRPQGTSEAWVGNRVTGLVLSLIVTGALDAYSVHLTRTMPGSGVAFVYPGIVFIIIFGIWFGVWGAIGAYVGTVIGGLLTGVNPDFLLLMKTANFVQALIPAIVYRWFNATSDLSNRKSICLYFAVCVLLTNLAGATVGVASEGLPVFGAVWRLWVGANITACLVLLPVVMLSFSRIIERSSLYVRGWM